MAKFDGEWSCYLVMLEQGKTRELIPIGSMYFRFEPNGELDEGRWDFRYEDVTYSTRLEGIATPGSHPRGLELETEIHDTFEGIQTFESGDGLRMIIAGKYHVTGESRVRELLKALNVQDDPPWIITKP